MSRLTLPFAALTVLGLAAAAPAPPTAAGMAGQPSQERAVRQCFLPQTLRNFRTDHDTTAYVRAGRGEVYLLQTSGCRGLSASREFGLTPASGGSACVGDSVTVSTRGPSLRNENNSICSARIVKRLSAEDVAALPSRLRP